MARKFDLISKLYLDTSKEVLSPDKWAAFLRSETGSNRCSSYREVEQDFWTLGKPRSKRHCRL